MPTYISTLYTFTQQFFSIFHNIFSAATDVALTYRSKIRVYRFYKSASKSFLTSGKFFAYF